MSLVQEWAKSLYDELLHDLEEMELATATVTPGPWHRVNTAIMKRVPDPVRGEERNLPLRAEGQERLVPDENFWDDVVMTEVDLANLANKPGTGYIGHTDREEDAAHMARCDREFMSWVISDYKRRVIMHMPEQGDPRCAHDGADWPCEETTAARRFVAQFHME